MSKSYNNTIDMFTTSKERKKEVMKIVTDSKELDDYGFRKSWYLERILDLLGYPVSNVDPTQTDSLMYASATGSFAASHFNPFLLVLIVQNCKMLLG